LCSSWVLFSVRVPASFSLQISVLGWKSPIILP
jgi:hypothetical protein